MTTTRPQELEFDSRLSERFFAEEEAAGEAIPTVNFKLPPADHKKLPAFLKTGFFRKSDGDKFRENTRTLFEDIIGWAKEQKIPDDTLELLNHVYKSRFLYRGKDEDVNKNILPLMTQGVIFLSGIAERIHDKTIPLAMRKQTVHDFAANMNDRPCPDGANTHITTTYQQLSTAHPISVVKRTIAEQTALGILKPYIDAGRISKGWEIHYTNAVLNPYADELGIAFIPDSYVADCDSDVMTEVLIQFAEKIVAALQVEAIFECIVGKLNVEADTLAALDDLEEELKRYGKDENYACQDLLRKQIDPFAQPDASENKENPRYDFLQDPPDPREQYKLVPNAHLHLWMTLQRRLSPYLSLEFNSVQLFGEGDKSIAHIPQFGSLKLAYVVLQPPETKAVPFITYCARKFLNQPENWLGRNIEVRWPDETCQEMMRFYKKEAQRLKLNSGDTLSAEQESWVKKLFKLAQVMSFYHHIEDLLLLATHLPINRQFEIFLHATAGVCFLLSFKSNQQFVRYLELCPRDQRVSFITIHVFDYYHRVDNGREWGAILSLLSPIQLKEFFDNYFHHKYYATSKTRLASFVSMPEIDVFRLLSCFNEEQYRVSLPFFIEAIGLSPRMLNSNVFIYSRDRYPSRDNIFLQAIQQSTQDFLRTFFQLNRWHLAVHAVPGRNQFLVLFSDESRRWFFQNYDSQNVKCIGVRHRIDAPLIAYEASTIHCGNLVVSQQGTLYSYRLDGSQQCSVTYPNENNITFLHPLPYGRLLVSFASLRTFICDASFNKQFALPGLSGVISCAISYDNKWVAIVGERHRRFIYRLTEDGQLWKADEAISPYSNKVAWLPNGNLVCGGNRFLLEQTPHFFINDSTDHEVFQLPDGESLSSFSTTPDGRLFVFTSKYMFIVTNPEFNQPSEEKLAEIKFENLPAPLSARATELYHVLESERIDLAGIGRKEHAGRISDSCPAETIEEIRIQRKEKFHKIQHRIQAFSVLADALKERSPAAAITQLKQQGFLPKTKSAHWSERDSFFSLCRTIKKTKPERQAEKRSWLPFRK